MSSPSHRPTIRDVAAEAGLSISTVSRALSGARAVSPQISTRVHAAAERLGYRVDSIGRSLRTQRTNTIGLVIPDITNPFFPAMVKAIEHAARQRSLGVLIVDSNNDPAIELAALRTLVDRRVDAVLISPTHLTASLVGLAETAALVPTIQFDRVIDDTLPFVRADQAAPMETIIAHLHSTGRRHLAFIGQEATVTTSREREDTFVRVTSRLFAEGPVRVLPGRMDADSGRAAAREIIAIWPETDAIICANDLIAVGVMQQLGAGAGRRAVAVAGFDDTLFAHALHLTSVRQPVEALATAAVSWAANSEAGLAPACIELSSEVMFRSSTD